MFPRAEFTRHPGEGRGPSFGSTEDAHYDYVIEIAGSAGNDTGMDPGFRRDDRRDYRRISVSTAILSQALTLRRWVLLGWDPAGLRTKRRGDHRRTR